MKLAIMPLNLFMNVSAADCARLRDSIRESLNPYGIPHIVFDNSYGKLSSFIEAWTKDCRLVQVVPSLEHAIARWSELQTR